MRRITSLHFRLDDKVDYSDLGKDLGKLTLNYDISKETAPFELLDCFDQSIRNSGRVLIFSNKRLILLQQDGATLYQPADESSVFVKDMKDGRVKSALDFVSPLRRLLPVTRGTLGLHQARAVDNELKTQVRLNLYDFRTDDKNARVRLATLQALRGYDQAFDLMREKIELAGWDKQQDIATLYGELHADYKAYNPKPDVTISRDERAFQAASDIIKTFIEIARLNEPGILADEDTEFLHDYRVSLRKVRSVLSLFKGIYSDAQTLTLKQEFAELMSPTGRLRDLDVYLLDRKHYFELLPMSLHDGLTIMFDIFEAERNEELGKISAYLNSSDYQNNVDRLAELFSDTEGLTIGETADQPAFDYACSLIWKRYRKVCKIARAITPETEDSEIHALRIQCKKLRYLMEFFSPMYPAKKIKALIRALKVLQDNLGLFNDYSVQQESLQSFILTHVSKGREQDLIIAKSVGALIAILYQKQTQERAKVVSNFEIFDSPEIQREFRSLFKNS